MKTRPEPETVNAVGESQRSRCQRPTRGQRPIECPQVCRPLGFVRAHALFPVAHATGRGYVGLRPSCPQQHVVPYVSFELALIDLGVAAVGRVGRKP